MPSISMLTPCGPFAAARPIAAIAAIVAFAAGCNGAEGQAQAVSPATPPSILVVGRGETHVKPDVAYVNLGVEARAATVSEAMQQNAAQMSQLVATLKRGGIEEKDVQTSEFNVRFERDVHPVAPFSMPVEPPAPPPVKTLPAGAAPKAASSGPAAPKSPKGPTGAPHPTPMAPPGVSASAPSRASSDGVYLVSNSVRIVVRDVTKVGPVIDAATNAGANNIWGITFELEKKEAMEGELRQKAVADARSRAEALAKLTGVELGPVLSVSEVVTGRDRPPPMPYAAGKMADESSSTPVEPGQIALNGQIQVVYAIKK